MLISIDFSASPACIELLVNLEAGRVIWDLDLEIDFFSLSCGYLDSSIYWEQVFLFPGFLHSPLHVDCLCNCQEYFLWVKVKHFPELRDSLSFWFNFLNFFLYLSQFLYLLSPFFHWGYFLILPILSLLSQSPFYALDLFLQMTEWIQNLFHLSLYCIHYPLHHQIESVFE